MWCKAHIIPLVVDNRVRKPLLLPESNFHLDLIAKKLSCHPLPQETLDIADRLLKSKSLSVTPIKQGVIGNISSFLDYKPGMPLVYWI